MKKTKKIFPAFIISIFIFIICFTPSCDDYKSKEFEITVLDSKACQQLQKADSLGVDSVFAVSITDFDSTWVDSVIYDDATNTFNNVSEILDSLIASDIELTNTTNKLKLITPGIDIVYLALQTNSASLTFFFDTSVSIKLISQSGIITEVSNAKMPLETAAGCTKLDDSDVEIPFIIARYEINVPENISLLQVIKNEQTQSNTLHVSIL